MKTLLPPAPTNVLQALTRCEHKGCAERCRFLLAAYTLHDPPMPICMEVCLRHGVEGLESKLLRAPMLIRKRNEDK